MILWCYDIVILWYCNIMILRYYDIVILWYCYVMILQYYDIAVLWYCSIMILWYCDMIMHDIAIILCIHRGPHSSLLYCFYLAFIITYFLFLNFHWLLIIYRVNLKNFFITHRALSWCHHAIYWICNAYN